MMKIAVIGAGWYGCHISKKLLQLGCDLTIYESQSDIFQGASGYNQNRLHQGFHYPRCKLTQIQTKSGFLKFKKEYEFLSKPIRNNIYAISKEGSKLNFSQYLEKVRELDMFKKNQLHDQIKLKNIEGSISVNEEYIDFKKAKEYFSRILHNKIIFNTTITQKSLPKIKKEFDYVIDCTYGQFNSFSFEKYYEANLLHLYKTKLDRENFAITIMDGNFFSLFPWEERIYSLTNVNKVILKKFSNFDDCLKYNEKIKKDSNFIKKHREDCEKEVIKFYPDFHNQFDYFQPEFSNKTKFENENDSRYVIIEREDNLIKVFSGKIDTIFEAEKKIITELKL